MRLRRFEWGCVAVIAAAFLLRLTFIIEPAVNWDTAWYLMNSRAFLETGTFVLRWSTPEAPVYSGYWPPLFPIFAAPFIALFGPSYHTIVAAAVGASALLVLGVFFMTRDLFDRPRAFAAAALVAAAPAFYVNDVQGMSESLLGLMVALTVWAFVKSLERPAWLPVAGGFAFLAYLGKATLGLPIVAAGVVALGAWRVYTRGWRRVVRSPVDIGVALAVIALAVTLALTRTEKVGGVGLGLISPLRQVFALADCGVLVGQLIAAPAPFHAVGPHCWALAFPLKIIFACAFLLVVTLPLSLRLPAALKARRTERTDALWLATLLPILAGAVFTTTFFFTERRSFVDFDNIRYLTPSIVPFIWVMLPLWTFEEEAVVKDDRLRRKHATWYWLGVGSLVVLLLLNPLAGGPTLGRFGALLLLGGVAVAISYVARNTQYAVVERHVGNSVERKLARAPYIPDRGRGIALIAIVLVVSAWFYSSWYASVGLGLVVALATPSPTRRVVAFAMVLLVSSAPSVGTPLPFEEGAAALARLPDGTVVGLTGVAAYSAAVAPDNVVIRLMSAQEPVPDGIDAIFVDSANVNATFEGFTRVGVWDYRLALSPTIAVRFWIEENFLGRGFQFTPKEGMALFVRDGTGLDAYVAPN